MIKEIKSITTGRFLFVAGLCIICSATWGFSQGEVFEKKKTERLAEIDEHLKKLQEHRDCVSNAATYEALRQCGDSMRSWRRDKQHDDLGKRQGTRSSNTK